MKRNLCTQTLVSGVSPPPAYFQYNRECAQREQLAQEQRIRESIADIRMRAGEDSLRAVMRLNRQEAEIKEAMKAQREALGLA